MLHQMKIKTFYFALTGEYTRKGMIVDMSIDNYVIPDINSKSDIVIGIWNDVISKSTNTENKVIVTGKQSNLYENTHQ